MNFIETSAKNDLILRKAIFKMINENQDGETIYVNESANDGMIRCCYR